MMFHCAVDMVCLGMIPDERTMFLELAEEIVLNLRGRLCGMTPRRSEGRCRAPSVRKS